MLDHLLAGDGLLQVLGHDAEVLAGAGEGRAGILVPVGGGVQRAHELIGLGPVAVGHLLTAGQHLENAGGKLARLLEVGPGVLLGLLRGQLAEHGEVGVGQLAADGRPHAGLVDAEVGERSEELVGLAAAGAKVFLGADVGSGQRGANLSEGPNAVPQQPVLSRSLPRRKLLLPLVLVYQRLHVVDLRRALGLLVLQPLGTPVELELVLVEEPVAEIVEARLLHPLLGHVLAAHSVQRVLQGALRCGRLLPCRRRHLAGDVLAGAGHVVLSSALGRGVVPARDGPRADAAAARLRSAISLPIRREIERSPLARRFRSPRACCCWLRVSAPQPRAVWIALTPGCSTTCLSL